MYRTSTTLAYVCVRGARANPVFVHVAPATPPRDTAFRCGPHSQVRIYNKPPETFPTTVPLPDATIEVDSSTLAGRTLPRNVLKAMLQIRTFSTSDLERMKDQARRAREALGELRQDFQDLADSGIGQAMQDSGTEAYEHALTDPDPMSAISQYEMPVNASQFQDYIKENGRDAAAQFFKLALSGTNPLTTDATVKCYPSY